MAVQVARKLFTVTEYDQMITAGIFTEDARLELIGGEIVEMSPIGIRHAACVKRLNHLFAQQLGNEAIIGVQDPIHLNDDSEPEPDIVLLHPRSDFYAFSHPLPKDVLLVIEVAETSLGYDREVKLPLYAQAGIPEVWLVDVDGRSITVYHTPQSGSYTHIETKNTGQATLTPQAFPQIKATVLDILGPDQ